MARNPEDSLFGAALRAARRRARVAQTALPVGATTAWQLERGRGAVASLHKVLEELGLEIQARNLPAGEGIGTRLRRLREMRRLSKRTLATLAGVSRQGLDGVETGGGRVEVLERVAEALGLRLRLVEAGADRGFWSTAAASSTAVQYYTPREVLDACLAAVGLEQYDLDPCSPSRDRRTAPVPARRYFTEEDDGLSLPWRGHTWLNPPYGREISAWTSKAAAEFEGRRAASITSLLPARTDTAWFQRDVAATADVVLLRGRLSFGTPSGIAMPAPFPSALAVWHQDGTGVARRIAERLGGVVLPRSAA